MIRSGAVGKSEWNVTDLGSSSRWLRAKWNETMSKSQEPRRNEAKQTAVAAQTVIGFQPKKLTPLDAATALDLDIVSTANWIEYRVRLKASLLDQQGRTLDYATTDTCVQAEAAPSLTHARLRFDGAKAGDVKRVEMEAEVTAQTGSYHGHGLWERYAADR